MLNNQQILCLMYNYNYNFNFWNPEKPTSPETPPTINTMPQVQKSTQTPKPRIPKKRTKPPSLSPDYPVLVSKKYKPSSSPPISDFTTPTTTTTKTSSLYTPTGTHLPVTPNNHTPSITYLHPTPPPPLSPCVYHTHQTLLLAKPKSTNHTLSNKSLLIPHSKSAELLPSTTTASSPSTSPTILNLFPEVLTHVFEYLDTRDKAMAASTCNYFYQVLTNRQLWKGTEAKLNLKPNNGATYNSLNQKGITRIQVLSLKRSLRELTSSVPITHLKLSGCYNVTNSSLNSMQNLTHLVSLDLSLCKQISDYSIICIIGKAPLLSTLDLGGCSELTDLALLLISYGLPNLKKLDLRSCYKLTDKSLTYLAGEFKFQKRLEPLVFDFLSKVGLIENPTCAICKRVGSTKMNLKKIDEHTQFGMVQLESLVLQDCQKISDEGLESLSKISTISKLNLSFCVNITDRGLNFLKELGSLEELNLRSCDAISDGGVANLQDCGKLEALDVSFCDKITRFNQGLCKHLKTLSMSACDIDDGSIQGILMEQLETLNLGQCKRITDAGLKTISENCPKLKYMDLYGCENISTRGLEHVKNIPTLKNVNLGLWKI